MRCRQPEIVDVSRPHREVNAHAVVVGRRVAVAAPRLEVEQAFA